MGLLESMVHHATLTNAVLAVPTLATSLILYLYLAAFYQDVRLKRIGKRGRRIPHKWPLGIDVVRRAVRATMEHTNLDLWRGWFCEMDSYTVEARLAGRRIVFSADPENIKAILATQFSEFGKGEPFHKEWKAFLGDSIFTTDGDTWHASRQLIRPQFVKDRISDLHCFESHMQTLFRAIAHGGALNGEAQLHESTKNLHGRPLDISELLFRYTLDVATDFLLGMDVKSMSTPREPFAAAFTEVQRVQSIISRAGALKMLVPKRSYWSGLDIINRFVNTYIERALALTPAELASKNAKDDMDYSFLHALAAFTKNRTVLRDQIIAVLLAGRDTTAATLSWTIYELARHPDCLARLRREILAVVGPDRTPTYEHLKSMKYLQNVMNETLRLYPVVPYNVRLALKDTTLPRGGGPDGIEPLAVLKHTPISYSTLVMQRRADLYPKTLADGSPFPDVETFSPERWFGWQPKPWQYVPFNGGPRICIGQQFALTEMGYVLTRLFQRFDRVVSYMDDVNGGRPGLKAEIVLSPGGGVRVAFLEPEGDQK